MPGEYLRVNQPRIARSTTWPVYDPDLSTSCSITSRAGIPHPDNDIGNKNHRGKQIEPVSDFAGTHPLSLKHGGRCHKTAGNGNAKQHASRSAAKLTLVVSFALVGRHGVIARHKPSATARKQRNAQGKKQQRANREHHLRAHEAPNSHRHQRHEARRTEIIFRSRTFIHARHCTNAGEGCLLLKVERAAHVFDTAS